jgi:hypothetical protein
MNESAQELAERRLSEALSRSGGRDPREFYRERLRALKAEDSAAFARGAAYYRDELIPGIAEGGAEPLLAWLEYGRLLAELTADGTTILVDESGKSHPYEPARGTESLVLHLPADSKRKAILVGLPAALSPAQKATYALLVEGKLRAGTAGD